ncbi:MAG: copper resistance protein CopC [Alsobacter sp.]
MGPHLRALLAALVAGLAILTGMAGPDRASAHASLLQSAPSDGAVLASGPAEVVLSFNEPVSPLAVRLIDADGTSRSLSARAEGSVVRAQVPALAPGAHALSWRVVSEDGHPVAGAVLFSVGGPAPGGGLLDADAPDPAARAALWLARLAMAVGLTFGVGGTVIRAWMGSAGDTGGPWTRAALLLGLAGCAIAPGLQGMDALGLPLASLPSGIAWSTGLGTRFGVTILLAGAAVVLALASGRGGVRSRRIVSAGALVLAGLAVAASGHASTASPQALTRPAVALHVVAAALWLGALVPLATGWRRREALAPFLGHASRLLVVPVGLLALSGLILAAIQVGDPAALLATAYGRVLLAKLAAVGLMLLLAAANRWRWTRPALAGNARAWERLGRLAAAEAVLALAVLGLAGLWRFTPPPRALALADARPASVHLHTAQAMADVAVTPGRSGPVTVSLSLLTGDFGPLDAKEVTLVFRRPDLGLESIRRPAFKPGDGTWAVRDLVLPAPGRWQVEVEVLIDDFTLARLPGELDLRP